MLYVRPFKDKWIFYFQVFNEATLLSCSYFLLVLCDILMANNLRISVGWYMVAVTLLNILANWLNLVISLLVDLIKKGVAKYRRW